VQHVLSETDSSATTPSAPALTGPRRGRPPKVRTLKKSADEPPPRQLTPKERLQILDMWERSALPACDFAPLVGVEPYTLRSWRRRFEEHGPAGLEDRLRAASTTNQKLSDLTRRAILMMKKAHPEYGCERISNLLLRGPALAASPSTVAKVLHDEGYELEETPTRPHEEPVRRFERAKPNQLWQTDLFTFILKRQNLRLYMVAFMDDHSRFIVGYGLHASASAPLVIEVVRAAIGAYGRPEEILTDNGPQYVTWRGKSRFARELEKRGIKHLVARPKRPQTLGKVERFWGSLWRECLETAVFRDLTEARKRVGHWIDHYNFQRPHQGLDGLVPADRFFGAESDVRKTLQARVAANALEVARDGMPSAPIYLTGQLGGKAFSIHSEGEKLILSREGEREEVTLAEAERLSGKPLEDVPPAVCPGSELESGGYLDEEPPPLEPGASPIDELLDGRDEESAAESDA
jgi:transposase InsO family protein